MTKSAVYAASAASLVLGLFFIFVWSPLPWGWKGIDGYDAISLDLAHGKPFPTIHIVWGYAYFLAFFYRFFGNHPAIPLTAQAILNACIPLLLYRLVKLDMDERIAAAAAVLTGLFSFNTLYASTQASDPVCTVLVVAAVLCFAVADRRQRPIWFAGAGLLMAAAYQFRPNLVLFPAFLAALYLIRTAKAVRHSAEDIRAADLSAGPSAKAEAVRHLRPALAHIAVFLGVFVAGAAPWVIRNYRWTEGLFVPASTHGGVQLWFGTLQTGAYRESWLYNPRAAFEFPPVDYSSLDEMPVVISATAPRCEPGPRLAIDLVYWTSRDRGPHRVTVSPDADSRIAATVPRQPSPTAVYYYFETTATDLNGSRRTIATPPRGAADPAMLVLSRDHLGDLDVDDHTLDVFDLVRVLRHVAWREPLVSPRRYDFDADGRVTGDDAARAASLIVDQFAHPAHAPDLVSSVTQDDAAATIRFLDGSAVAVPRRWQGHITDLQLTTPIVQSTAALLVQRSVSWPSVDAWRRHEYAPSGVACLTLEAVTADRVPYRRLPHELRRFTALALDNIRRDPLGYAAASALRALRVFIITGSDDQRTAYQFSGAGRVYAIGRAASLVFFGLFVAGVGIAVARRMHVFMLVVPIAYIPLTICFMLINARYSMSVQPFVFAFVAVSLVSAYDAVTARRRPSSALHQSTSARER
jgi:dolichyl-phosphate-mannose-protein mannosyltransferase